MSERPPCVLAFRPHRILIGPLALAIALTSWGCSPAPAPSPEAGVTSKVPEIAKRQKHMEEMQKKADPKSKSVAKSH